MSEKFWGRGPGALEIPEITLRDGELAVARVVAQQRARLTLAFTDRTLFGEPAGALRHAAELDPTHPLPVIGDFVLARRPNADGACLVERVLPRRSKLSRKSPGRAAEEQVLAANVDALFVVMSIDGDFSPRRLERYLVMAHEGGVEPVVVLSKCDLLGGDDELLDEKLDQCRLAAGGASIHAISTYTGEGLEALEAAELGAGRTVALLGSSGVGKSTLVNALLGEERQRTQPVRADDDTGRHTTTDRTLLVLPGGALLVDAPGLRELEPWAGDDALSAAFDEIGAIAERCRFRDCRHVDEPGCAVRAAVESGELSEERWESHQRLERELAYQARRRDAGAAAEEKRRWKIIHKSLKHHPKYGGRE
ncbi:ribosome small subunit-dependent GTPase A [Myxococcota bacterium]|nr:ribosome small subunit-dependent GTPase A [Myxococcota bacterium]